MMPIVGTLMGAGRRGGVAPVVTSFSLLTDAQTANLVGGTREDYTRSGVRYIGAVNVSEGKQYVVGVDLASGAIVSKTNTCSSYTSETDDHNPAVPWLMPDGVAAVYLASGHNTHAEFSWSYSADGNPANAGAVTAFTVSDLLTYPYPLEHADDGVPRLAFRCNQVDWCFVRSTLAGNGGWVQEANPVWHDTDQTYCYFKKIGPNLYLGHAARNSNNDAKLYSFTVDASTGAIKNAAGTTIANFKTGSPAASATPANADMWLDPGAGWSASPGNWFPDGLAKYYTRGDTDNQYEELIVATCDDLANRADPAHWTHVNVATANNIGPVGYGVGSTTSTPFSSTARPRHVDLGDGVRRLLYSQILGGVVYNSIIEEVSAGVWRSVLPVAENAQNTDHTEFGAWNLGGAGNKAIAVIRAEDHANYNAITNAQMKVLVLNSTGVSAPAITSSASASVDEFQDWMQAITTSDPAGIYISGGADAASFEIIGGKYLRLFRAANYDAPHDANSDNVFVVDIKARGLNGLESAAQTFTLTINQLTKTGGSNLFLQTANVTNAAWTKTAINNGSGAGQTNSADFVDSAGTNTLNKLQQTIASARHRAGQTRTHTANTEHSIRMKGRGNTNAHYWTIQPSFGSGNGSLTATFDVKRGRFVGAASIAAGAGAVPSRTWCIPAGNSNFDFGITYTSPGATGSGENALIVRQFAGPGGTETGSTGASTYFNEPMHNTGKVKNYVARTT